MIQDSQNTSVPETNPEQTPVPEAETPQEPAPKVEAPDSPIPGQESQPEPTPPKSQPAPQLRATSPDFRTIIREAKKKKYEVRLEKVLNLAREKGKITNDDIQKALRVSDATATRYVKTLISRGQLKRSGKTKSIFYEPL